MKRNRWAILICALILPAAALAEPLSLADVVHITLTNHPDLAINRVGISMAEADQQRIEGSLDPMVSGRVGYSDEKTPSTSPFAADRSQSGYLSGTIVKPLEDGSSLTGSINYSRTSLNFPNPALFQTNPNPAFTNQVDLTYRYPLLRGHGNPGYHELLTAAKQDTDSARWNVEMLKEGLASQAIGLYFQLALDQLGLKIASDALDRAKRLLSYQEQREKFGLIEKADRLQAEALLASRRMDLSNALASVRLSQTNLNRLLLRSAESDITPEGDEAIIPSSDLATMSIDAVLEKARQNRPVFKSLQARLAAAEARLAAARDQNDTQVDLVGQVGSRALEPTAGKAAGQGFSLTNRFVGVSLEVSDTIGGKATGAAIRKAELARHQVELEKIQASENVESDISTALSRLITGNAVLVSAEARAKAEADKFDAEMKRYREGRSNTATIIQFEGDLRLAELQVAIQKTSLQLATQQLLLAEGELFSHLFGSNYSETGELNR